SPYTTLFRSADRGRLVPRPRRGTASDLVLDPCSVPVGHLPRERDAVQGDLAAARPGVVCAATTPALGGDHARRLRDGRRGGLRRPEHLAGESAGAAAPGPCGAAGGAGWLLPWMVGSRRNAGRRRGGIHGR